jgi:hypothetical protein
LNAVQGIPGEITIREVLSLQLKKILRKGCQLFETHMEETHKDNVSNIEYYFVLKEFELDVST